MIIGMRRPQIDFLKEERNQRKVGFTLLFQPFILDTI